MRRDPLRRMVSVSGFTTHSLRTPRRLDKTSAFPVRPPHSPLRSFLGSPALALPRGGVDEQLLPSLIAPLQNYILLNTRRSACDGNHRQKHFEKGSQSSPSRWTFRLAFEHSNRDAGFAWAARRFPNGYVAKSYNLAKLGQECVGAIGLSKESDMSR